MAEKKPTSVWDSASSLVSGTDPSVGKCSDDEILKTAPKRKVARDEVEAHLDYIKKSVNPWMIQSKVPQSTIDSFQGFFEEELKWYEKNQKLCEIDVKTRQNAYNEKRKTHIKKFTEIVWPFVEKLPSGKDRDSAITSVPIPEWKQFFMEKNKGIKDTEAKVEKEKKKKIQSRTFGDNVKDGIGIAMRFIIPIVWILLALRFGGFAMSDLLYKPIPYRLLAWLYTFIFMPVFIPYYGYKELRYQLDPLLKRLGIVSEDAELPRFESMFPIFPYKGDEEITVQYKLFGYPSTKENEAWVTAKQEEENTNRLDFVSGTQAFLDKIIKAKEESMKEK